MQLARAALAGTSILLISSLCAAQAPPSAAQPAPPYATPPAGYAPFSPTEHRMVTHSKALLGGGVALLSLGVISCVGGGVTFTDRSHQGTLSLLVGLPVLINGVGMIAGGIPMIVIGARKIPVEVPRMMPSVVSSRGGAGLSWKF